MTTRLHDFVTTRLYACKTTCLHAYLTKMQENTPRLHHWTLCPQLNLEAQEYPHLWLAQEYPHLVNECNTLTWLVGGLGFTLPDAPLNPVDPE